MTTLPFRDAPGDHAPETLLGVCSAIAEATGLPPLVVRVAFVFAILGISIEWAVGAYLVFALALAASRLGWGAVNSAGGRR